jgi:hypothetical protein
MSETAIIFGNGKSRKMVDFTKFCIEHRSPFVYGCNLVYEEFPVDVIVATDPLSQHKIYREYQGEAELLFLDWSVIPSEMAASVASMDQNVSVNEYTPHGCVISGEGNHTAMTYLRENDNVMSVSPSLLPIEMSSGSMAMWDAAEKGYENIFLAGFGDVDHAYYDQLRGDEERKKVLWEKERRYLIEKYSEINWVYL